MVRYERYLEDPAVLAAILDLCDIVHVGFQDRRNAYVLPMCFGYQAAPEALRIFLHTSNEGYKLRLIEQNPRVCCSFAQWRNFPERPYRDHVHDFRSVVAFGEMRLIDPVREAAYRDEAMWALFRKTRRHDCKNPKGMAAVNMYVVECLWEDVTGKSEFPVRGPEDVPFADFDRAPPDDRPFDDRDLYETRRDRIRSGRYLGYLEEEEPRQ